MRSVHHDIICMLVYIHSRTHTLIHTLHYTRWKEQESYIDSLLSKLESSSASEVAKLKDSESKLQLQVQESTRRENVLNMRLATKQQEMQDLMVNHLFSCFVCSPLFLCSVVNTLLSSIHMFKTPLHNPHVLSTTPVNSQIMDICRSTSIVSILLVK